MGMTATVRFQSRLVCLLALAACSRAADVAGAVRDDGWTSQARPLLAQYCWRCHGHASQKGDLDLESLDGPAALVAVPGLITKLRARLRQDEMPPPTAAQPGAAERASLIAWLDQRLGMGAAKDDPGEVVIAHLTPTQYERAIRDLTGVDVPVALLLPHDGGAGEGFDNVGASQVVTPTHLQAYLAAAAAVVGHARVSPGQPIAWLQGMGAESATTADKYATVLADWGAWFSSLWRNRVIGESAKLQQAGLVPNAGVWERTIPHYGLRGTEFLIVYLHAAWQYRYRNELGHPAWTPADAAAAYAVPLVPEVLERLIRTLTVPTPNLVWQRLERLWQALPKPPQTDEAMRARCLDLVVDVIHHVVIGGDDQLQGNERTAPFEVDPRTWLTLTAQSRSLMYTQGLRPFRFTLGGRTELWLVTTDAGDGNDDDYMIWEHGVFTRGGKDEPWTSLAVSDLAGATVRFGSHPMGAAAQLPAESICVHAPAVLHLRFPPGTTDFRVDARADPRYARDGSMQVVPFDRPPTDDELHFVCNRYVIAAGSQYNPDRKLADARGPSSSRQRTLEDLTSAFDNFVSESYPPRNSNALMPADVRARWHIGIGPPMPEDFRAGYPGLLQKRRGFDQPYLWQPTLAMVDRYATPEELASRERIKIELSGTIEARDALAGFLDKHKAHCDLATALLTTEPAGLKPAEAAELVRLRDATRADELRLLDCARTLLADFAQRAWRRPPAERSLASLLGLYQQARDDGLCYETAIKRALVPVLASPLFLYRDQVAQAKDAPYALGGRELADRLASVLWGSIPDAPLIARGAPRRTRGHRHARRRHRRHARRSPRRRPRRRIRRPGLPRRRLRGLRRARRRPLPPVHQ